MIRLKSQSNPGLYDEEALYHFNNIVRPNTTQKYLDQSLNVQFFRNSIVISNRKRFFFVEYFKQYT